ncbi:hypothetical protein Tsubulata_009994 [Turnera subulata]|uniref:Uncharacterized protein n=1 Tax=Turnera subulata TaxID=218843 RepID=A0A9Q0G615_9ROSI|nr:hypothetical protein Tsubulata_009994 [Turnera subulata]
MKEMIVGDGQWVNCMDLWCGSGVSCVRERRFLEFSDKGVKLCWKEADEVLADGDEGEGDTGLVDPIVRPSNPNDKTATFPNISTNPSTTSGSKKRKKSSDNLDVLAGAIVNGIDNYGVYVEKLADAMIGKDPTRVIGSELKRLGLTPNQLVSVAMKLSTNPDLARYFWEMDDEQRQELINTLLFD